MSYRFADSLRAGENAPARKLLTNLCVPLLCVQWKTPDDGKRNCLKHVDFHSKNKFEKLVHLVGFIVRDLSRCTVTWTSDTVFVFNFAVIAMGLTLHLQDSHSWFQTFAVFWMLYAFFWVILRRLNFMCRHFGTLCLFHLHRRIGVEFYTYPPMKLEQTECSEMSAYKIQTPGNYPEESIQQG